MYLINYSSKVGQSYKLKAIWKGPYLVIKVISPVFNRIKGLKREVVVHHDRLKLCMDRSIPMWMRRLRQHVLDMDETLPYEEDDDDQLGLTTFCEPPQQDNVQCSNSLQVSANQETSTTNLTQNSETFLADLLESNSEPL